ncbi:MAG: integrase arm-type DNA-binding domain-containing protein [Pseudomonadota bacterium]
MRHKLTDAKCKSINRPGRHADGDCLYLSVSKTGSKSWIFLFQKNKIRKEMGLGSYNRGSAQVSLARARQKAEEIRAILGDGGDPFVEFSERKDQNRISFGEASDQYLATMESQWSNPKHRDQWHMTLSVYAKPIRRLPVDGLATDDILRVLKPIWQSKTETASRLRGRVEKVIDYATTQGWRSGDNPARWVGHLQNVLPSPKKRKVKHHAAMPYKEVPAFLERLRGSQSLSALALELTILCATRTKETLEATWSEIDLENKVWTIPQERMKANREHRIPLSSPCIEILESLPRFEGSEFLFSGQAPRRPISAMSMTKQVRRLAPDYTTHGFRSSFRDWAGEETSFPREIAEQALAHVVGDETERAYRRGDALEKRRKLMEAWSSYLENQANQIVPFRSIEGG